MSRLMPLKQCYTLTFLDMISRAEAPEMEEFFEAIVVKDLSDVDGDYPSFPDWLISAAAAIFPRCPPREAVREFASTMCAVLEVDRDLAKLLSVEDWSSLASELGPTHSIPEDLIRLARERLRSREGDEERLRVVLGRLEAEADRMAAESRQRQAEASERRERAPSLETRYWAARPHRHIVVDLSKSAVAEEDEEFD